MEEVLVGHLVVVVDVVDISDLTEKEDTHLMEKSHRITTKILKVNFSFHIVTRHYDV